MAAVGLFGGSFDPVHNGHVALARAAIDQYQLNPCYVVPAYRPPHKGQTEAPFADRLAMVSLAFADIPQVAVSDREAGRGGMSYTIETVQELQRVHPEDDLCLIVGADTAEELRTWKQPQDILAAVRLLVAPRPGSTLPDEYADRAETIVMEDIPISASQIRRAARKGESIAHLVPASVAAYIESHTLYCGRSGAAGP